jgi:hypothetical protein
VIATAMLAAAGLALSGQPVSAAPPHIGAGKADRPAPIDPHGATAHAQRRAAEPKPAGHKVPNPLLREVLAGEDDAAEEGAALSALCQDFIGKPNPYANPAPNVDAINGDTIVTVGSQTGCSTAQNETTIAVNPFNPRNLVAGSNDYRVFNPREQRNDSSGWAYTTFDGGRTWANIQVPHLTFQTGASAPLSYMDAAGDPALAFGPNNTVYYANLVFSRVIPTDGSQQASGMAVSTSHDGGLTWGEPVLIQLDGVNRDGTPTPTDFFNDKEWITADPLSGTVYVSWTRFTFDAAGNYLESPIVVSRSTDFGRHFSPMTRVAPSLNNFKGGITPFDQGSNPGVGRNGTLFIAYEASVCETAACDAAGDHDAVVVATSRDGGRTFRNEEVAADFDFPVDEATGSPGLTGENFRINSYPTLAVDRLTNQLWITWADDRNGQYSDDGESIKTNGDVFVVGSVPGGGHWTDPLRVGSGADEVFPGIAVFAGRVAVSYYTRAFDPNGIGLDYAYSVGWGAGIRGASVRRITTQTENPQVQFVAQTPDGTVLQGVFIGDYSAIAMGVDFVIHPCWTDFRGKPGTTTPNQDVYSQAIFAL